MVRIMLTIKPKFKETNLYIPNFLGLPNFRFIDDGESDFLVEGDDFLFLSNNSERSLRSTRLRA